MNEFLDIVTKINDNKRVQVAVLGAPLLSTLQYFKSTKNKFKNIIFSNLTNNPDAKYVIVSGDLELLYAILIRIATGANQDLELKTADLVILTTPPTKGEELHHAQVLDELARTQASVLALSDRVINKMAPYYEDVKMMCGIFKPLYFLPVQGLYKDLKQAKQAANDAGVFEKNCLLIKNGVELSWKKGILSPKRAKIKTGTTYVEVAGTNDVEWSVLRERQQLSADGTAIISVAVDKKTKKPITRVDIQMRGVVFIDKTDRTLQTNINEHFLKIVHKYQNKFLNNEVYNLKELRREATNIIGKLIQQKTKKRPIILIVVYEI